MEFRSELSVRAASEVVALEQRIRVVAAAYEVDPEPVIRTARRISREVGVPLVRMLASELAAVGEDWAARTLTN
jgi:hypothetical protein